jgi:thiosulfate/3-mercaptopyruvate sulfurtransferase
MIDPIVPLSWLTDNREEVVLADVRWYLDGRSGREAFDKGHMPGAVFVDLDTWLAGHSGAGRHPFPSPETFATGMSRLGIGNGSLVIGYDDQGGIIASRLVWMLRMIGHEAALLDGGLAAYSGGLETEEHLLPEVAFTPRPWPREALADIDAATDASNIVIDARPGERFRGEIETVDPRAGHIPGARSVPCRENLDRDGKFLPIAELRKRFEVVASTDPSRVISYCGSGVSACQNLLAIEHCGLGKARLYPGSWSEYSSAPDRDVELGDAR